MKILHIASGDLWGGAEAQLNALCGATLSLGAETSVALLNRNSELGRRVRAHGIDVIELDETIMSAPALMAGILRYGRRTQPDVVHTHRFKENIIGGAVARLLGVGSVRTVHGAPEPELEHLSMRRRVLNFVDAAVAKYLQHRVVAVSDDLAGKLRPMLPGANIVVIRNGVDVAELRRRSSQPSEVPPQRADVLRIGYFGRLVPVKRLDLLLQAIAELAGRLPVELFVVGEGPQQHSLHEMADRLRLAEHVHFVGFQANAAAWIRAMDCVALTSDHEGLPMIVLEALALGVPVVARAVGGIPEVLQAVNPAWLIDGNSAADIAKVLESMSGQRTTLGGASLLPERYSAETMAREYLALYESVITARRAQPPLPAVRD